MERVSIIIPLYNEEDSIDFLVTQLNGYFADKKKFKTEIIFVNDGSSDKTSDLIKKANHEFYSAKLCNLSKNCGSHAALRAGILHSSGDYIGFMYADLQDPLELINQLFDKMMEGYDIAWAKRKDVELSFFEKRFSKMYASLMKKYVSQIFPEQGFDVVMFSKKIAGELNKNIESNSSIFLHVLTLGYKQASIEYNKRPRKTGVSKWTLSKKMKLLIDSFVSFSYAPIRLVSVVGLIFFILGILWTGYIVFRKIVFNDLLSGWPALTSILMIGFGITNISLGIIAEYLWRTLDASRKRPVFIIDEIIEINKEEKVKL